MVAAGRGPVVRKVSVRCPTKKKLSGELISECQTGAEAGTTEGERGGLPDGRVKVKEKRLPFEHPLALRPQIQSTWKVCLLMSLYSTSFLAK